MFRQELENVVAGEVRARNLATKWLALPQLPLVRGGVEVEVTLKQRGQIGAFFAESG
jgi:hypothetical protein